MRTKYDIAAVACALVTSAALLLGAGCARAPAAAPVADAAPAAATVARVPVGASAPGFDARVAELGSDDFETRTRAARALVAAGETALPALGRAGDAPVPAAGGVRVSSTRAVIDAIFAKAPEPALENALRTEWSVVRRGAAAELGRRDRWDAIPLLIRHLDDSNADVRAASGSALRRLTNNFFGFRAEARLGHRRSAAGRWRDWWSREGRAEARERAARNLDGPTAR